MRSSKRTKRKQYVVNKRLQWQIAWQTIITWVIGTTVALIFPIVALFICGIGFAEMTFNEVLMDVSKAYTFPLLMAVVFMPLAIWHSFQFSNRIAGPMYRFEREIKSLLDGDSIKPIQLRPNDYWQAFADDFNVIADRLGQLEKTESAKATKGEVETVDDATTSEKEVAAETKPDLVGA